MFERFTDRSRVALSLAAKELEIYNSKQMTYEHIFMGFLKEGTGVGIHALKYLNIDLETMQKELDEYLKNELKVEVGEKENKQTAFGKILKTITNFIPSNKFSTFDSKKVIDNAISIAKSLNHNYVGTEHLLLSLMKCSNSKASKMLLKKGLDREKIENAMLIVTGKKEPDRLKTE